MKAQAVLAFTLIYPVSFNSFGQKMQSVIGDPNSLSKSRPSCHSLLRS